jgi:DNA polymerase-1
MGKWFDTAKLDEAMMKELSSDEASWIYNGLDCCVTAEIYNVLAEEIATSPPEVAATYDFALRKMAPIMEASLRGTLIDEGERQAVLREFSQKLSLLDAKFQRLCLGIFDTEINWRSPLQLKTLFYGSLGLKERRKRNAKGQYVPTVNEEALEHFKVYLHAYPFSSLILAMRELSKAIGFLKTEIDDDSRMRTSYNLAGTNTGRLSSRMSDFGTGTNVQNVDRSLRKPFVADAGKYLVNIDLEQADARNVGAILWNLFHDTEGPEYAGAYLDACESGDLHTQVCRMAWPNLDWPQDNTEWKDFCDGLILFGQDSYRQVAKKLGHGTNYYGTPRTMAQHTKSPVPIIEDFQRNYFNAFPAIPAWHKWIISELDRVSTLHNLFGRRRIFFGRPDDATTIRQAIAYSPQSSTGEEIDRGWYQVWSHFGRDVEFLNQVHDSLLLQIPLEAASELIPQILEVMRVEIELVAGRRFSVPLEAKAGWNWGNFDPKKNTHGLKTWKGREERDRPSPRKRLKDYL